MPEKLNEVKGKKVNAILPTTIYWSDGRESHCLNIKDIEDLTVISTRDYANIVTGDYANIVTGIGQVLRCDNITLDFEGIEVVTRSFFDQLNANIAKSSKEYRLINLNGNLTTMLNIVNPKLLDLNY